MLNSPAEVAKDRWFLFWLRIPNIALGAATVAVTFLSARTIAQDRWTPVIAATAVAFFPQFVFHTAFVNNDNLVTLLGAILTFTALQFTRTRTTSSMVATGATYGLLITTKLSVIPIGLILPVLAVLVPTCRRQVVVFAYGTLSALAASVWYLAQNWARYGDPLALRASTTYLSHVGGLGTRPGVR